MPFPSARERRHLSGGPLAAGERETLEHAFQHPLPADVIGSFARGGTVEDARKVVLDALGGISIGRAAEPEEVADLIAYVASDRAAAIHGAEFIIDGGTVRTV